MRLVTQIWLSLCVAIIAASVADPLMEFASNAGWFGPGTFTDHSNWDVIPALAAGSIVAGFCLYLRVWDFLVASACSERLRDLPTLPHADLLRLFPLMFGLQILMLFSMETAEQFVVYGHIIGPWVWLGGPALVSLGVHALTCAMIAVMVARMMRALAASTVRFVHRLGVIMRLRIFVPEPVHSLCLQPAIRRLPVHVLRCVAERAPPSLL